MQCPPKETEILWTLASNPGSAELNASLGVCYVSLGLFDKAIPLLEKAIDLNPANADSYYMAAVARLRGKSPYMAKRDDINKVIELLNAANMVAPKAIYFYLLGFVKEKYFEAKYLNVVPSAAQEYTSAQEMGIYDDEIQALKELIRC